MGDLQASLQASKQLSEQLDSAQTNLADMRRNLTDQVMFNPGPSYAMPFDVRNSSAGCCVPYSDVLNLQGRGLSVACLTQEAASQGVEQEVVQLREQQEASSDLITQLENELQILQSTDEARAAEFQALGKLPRNESTSLCSTGRAHLAAESGLQAQPRPCAAENEFTEVRMDRARQAPRSTGAQASDVRMRLLIPRHSSPPC